MGNNNLLNPGYVEVAVVPGHTDGLSQAFKNLGWKLFPVCLGLEIIR